MTSKCGNCGKFASLSNDAVKCDACASIFHRRCIGFKVDATIPTKWVCKACKSKQKKGFTSHSCVTSPDTDSSEAAAVADTHNDEINMAQEVKMIRAQLNTILQELTHCRQDIVTFRQELLKINTSLADHNSRLSTVESKVNNVTKRLAEVETKIGAGSEFDIESEIERRLNDRDQNSYSTDVEITGLEELPGENPVHIVTTLAQKIGVSIGVQDVVHAERRGKSRRHGASGSANVPGSDDARPRTLVVRLARHALRAELLRAARVRRDVDTSGIIESARPRRFFVNERLTWFNRRLFHQARQEARSKSWRFTWCREGKIYVRRDAGSKSFRIRKEADIEKVFSGNSP